MAKIKGTGKPALRQAIAFIDQAEKAVESVREHFDMPWGENAHSELDVSLSHAVRKLEEARTELNEILARYRGRALRPNYPRKRTRKPGQVLAVRTEEGWRCATVRDLQKALVC